MDKRLRILVIISILFLGGCTVDILCPDVKTLRIGPEPDDIYYTAVCSNKAYTLYDEVDDVFVDVPSSGSKRLEDHMTTAGQDYAYLYPDKIVYDTYTWTCQDEGWDTCKQWLTIGTITCSGSTLTIGATDYMTAHTPACFPCTDYSFEGTVYECENPTVDETIITTSSGGYSCTGGTWSCSLPTTTTSSTTSSTTTTTTTLPTSASPTSEQQQYSPLRCLTGPIPAPEDLEDDDEDGLANSDDSCPDIPNGPDLGSCSNDLEKTCNGDTEEGCDDCYLENEPEACASTSSTTTTLPGTGTGIGGPGGGTPGGGTPGGGTTPTEPVDRCPGGDDTRKDYPDCPDDFEETYSGVKFKIQETSSLIDTRDPKFCDSFGDYMDGSWQSEFPFIDYDTEHTIIDSSLREEVCWFLLEAGDEDPATGDNLDFYVKFDHVKDMIGAAVACEEDSDCEEEQKCIDNVCTDVVPCETDEDCGAGQVCVDDICIEACTDDEDCEEGQICVDDICIDACETDEDCEEGQECIDNVCTDEDVEYLVEITPVIGFAGVDIEDFATAKAMGAKTVGYPGVSVEAALEEAAAEGLEIFLKHDSGITSFTDNEIITGYWMLDNDCSTELDTRQLRHLYSTFKETNSKTPVMMNFDDLECALGYIEAGEKRFTDIILFNLDSTRMPDSQDTSYLDEQKELAEEIIEMSKEKYGMAVAIMAVINAQGSDERIADEEWIEDLGIDTADNSVFRGIIFLPWTGEEQETLEEVKVAFLANQGVNQDAQDVLELIEGEDTDLVVHLGNFGYESTADEWELMVNSILGEDFPYIGVIGSQEYGRWTDYQNMIQRRFKDELDCNGITGDKMVCNYKGVFILLSGVGISETQGHVDFMTQSLEDTEAKWKICAMHKDHVDFRVTSKGIEDQLSSIYYGICGNSSAIIATGYEETYARTKTMVKFDYTYGGSEHISEGSPEKIILGPKKTFAFVSGLGGHGHEAYSAEDHADDTWWAKIYATGYESIERAMPGALFITFNHELNPNKAVGEFITTDPDETARIVDSFEIEIPGVVITINRYIKDVSDEPEYIEAFNAVFEKADADFRQCSTPAYCLNMEDCLDSGFYWTGICVECVLDEHCAEGEECSENVCISS